MQAPERMETAWLILRRPHAADAPAIVDRYASDPEVTRWLGWPRHTSIADTEGFLAFCDAEWTRAPAGPYLIEGRDGARLGSVDHEASAHVLDKCGYAREGVLRRHTVFPNSGLAGPLDVLSYARTW